VDHLREKGFTVDARDVGNLAAIKRKHGVPTALESCHTALVDGYVVEGHVPADVIDQLLRERPKVVGLAVPGMPVGSPGMESPGRKAERYDIVAFDARGGTRVFARRWMQDSDRVIEIETLAKPSRCRCLCVDVKSQRGVLRSHVADWIKSDRRGRWDCR
jgi:hypothetical protein